MKDLFYFIVLSPVWKEVPTKYVQAVLDICGLFICDFSYMRLRIVHFCETYPLIHCHRWSFYMRIGYIWSLYLAYNEGNLYILFVTKKTTMYIRLEDTKTRTMPNGKKMFFVFLLNVIFCAHVQTFFLLSSVTETSLNSIIDSCRKKAFLFRYCQSLRDRQFLFVKIMRVFVYVVKH